VAYRLAHTEAALRDLQALPREMFGRVDARILALADNPRPRGAERIRGTRGALRVRVVDYRILYTVDDAQQIVTIGRIGLGAMCTEDYNSSRKTEETRFIALRQERVDTAEIACHLPNTAAPGQSRGYRLQQLWEGRDDTLAPANFAGITRPHSMAGGGCPIQHLTHMAHFEAGEKKR
jgi:mRNA interferase RelE/StbE